MMGIATWLASKGLGWLVGPTGKALAIGVALVLGAHMVRQGAFADCREEQLEAALAQAAEDQAKAEVIAEEARERADVAQAKASELERLTNEIIDNSSPDGCVLSDELRQQLEAIQ